MDGSGALLWPGAGEIVWPEYSPMIEIGEGDIVSTLNKTIDLLDQFSGLLAVYDDQSLLVVATDAQGSSAGGWWPCSEPKEALSSMPMVNRLETMWTPCPGLSPYPEPGGGADALSWCRQQDKQLP